jgi:DNA polymerase-3 subunit epsilon/ATP-dependent DNA helicase DinG
LRHPYVALDTETTGLEAGRDEIIEVAAVRFQGPEVLGTWHSLIKPAASLPEAITRLTGITPQDLETAPMFYTVVPELARFIGDDPVVGHSVGFDIDFLAAQGLPLRNRQVDTFELSTLLLPQLPDRSLISVARHLEIPYPEQHRALADAQMSRQVLLAFWKQLAALDLETLEEILKLAGKADWPLGALFEEVATAATREAFGKKRPSAQPLAMRLVRPEPRPEPLEETEDERPIDGERLSSLLAPGGLFPRVFPHYEHRPQQVEMLQAVARTFNQGGQLIVEAGTGTGKSMAYLLPSVALAMRRCRPVVVSTNTINLQDQLFYKDLPDLQHVLAQAGPEEGDMAHLAFFHAALLKGRANYICLRRWEALRRSPMLTPEQVSVLAKTLLWLPRTRTGDRGELALVGREHAVWGEVAAASSACQGSECVYNQEDLCFFYRARRRAEAAHIVIANHSLLLSDVATENRVLPAYRYLVVDEAHHLEGVATDQLGFSVNAEELGNLLAEVSLPAGLGREEGLLAFLPALFKGDRVPEAARDTLRTLIQEVRSAVEATRRAGQGFFTELDVFIRQQQERTPSTQYDWHWRITPAIRIQPDWTDIEIAWENASVELGRIVDRLSRLSQLAGPIVENASREEQDVLLELNLLGQRVLEVQQQVTAIVSQSQENGIYWVSVEAQSGTLGLHSAPLHVGDLLQENLYTQKEAIVLTSATLSTESNTSFLRERLDLPEADELLLDSPFDYRSAALLLLPEDMPDPRDPQYGRALARTLIQTCQASQGRTLVLFTAHSTLRQAYGAIRRPLEHEDIAVLGQGIDGSRHILLDKFRRNPRSVLLGTSSFWEGIDVAGEALSVLVITKLPFDVPSDPIFAARCELFENPFQQYAVPQAVLRFKQGFGRLIRTQTDRGVVIMLDGRVLSKTYGPVFLHSLPPCTTRRVHLLEVPRLVQEWLEQPRR